MWQEILQGGGGGAEKRISIESISISGTFNMTFEGMNTIKAGQYVANNSYGGLRLYDENDNVLYTFASGTVTDFIFDVSSYNKVIMKPTPDDAEYNITLTNLTAE